MSCDYECDIAPGSVQYSDNLTASEIKERYISLATSTYNHIPPCKPFPVSDDCKKKSHKAKEKEKENTMAYVDNNNLETQQRNHLTQRVRDIDYAKRSELRKTYNIDFDARPMTKDELLRKLAAGEFKVNDGDFNAKGELLGAWMDPRHAIEWFDPAHPADKTGYDAAKVVLEKARIAAKDAALLLPLTDALKAVQAFEAQTF